MTSEQESEALSTAIVIKPAAGLSPNITQLAPKTFHGSSCENLNQNLLTCLSTCPVLILLYALLISPTRATSYPLNLNKLLKRQLSVFGPFTYRSFNVVDPLGNEELLTNLTGVVTLSFNTS